MSEYYTFEKKIVIFSTIQEENGACTGYKGNKHLCIIEQMLGQYENTPLGPISSYITSVLYIFPARGQTSKLTYDSVQ